MLKLGIVEARNRETFGGEESCLAVSAVQIIGVKLFALMDTGATPNVMSPQVVMKLSLKPGKTSMVGTAATGEKSGAIEKLSNVSVMFGALQAETKFIMLENISFYIIIGRPTLKRVGGVLDFKVEDVQMEYF